MFLNKSDVPDYTQRRWGGYVGGPIIKDRLFFFAGYEDLNFGSNDFLAISDYWKAQGYHSVEPVKRTDHPFLVKGDYNISPINRLSVRYDRTIYKTVNAGDTLLPDEGRATYGGPTWNIVANLASTLGKTSFNEFRGYYMSTMPLNICNASGTGGMANLEKGPPGTFSLQFYPTLAIGCPIGSGLEGEGNLGFIDNFSFVRGRHQVKFGGQAIQNRMIVDLNNFHDGMWGFEQDLVFDKNDPSTYPFFFAGNTGPGAWRSPIWNFNLFIQDIWQVRDNLTLNLGMRYDVDRSVMAGNEFVDQRNAALVAKLGGAPPFRKTTVDYNNVSPRLGIVWAPTASKRTTVRGAFGLFYDQNHGNVNSIYIINSLLGDVKSINCSSPLHNPFWDSGDPPAAITACKSFLAQSFPFFPDMSKAPAATQGLDTLDPHLQVPRTTQYTSGVAHEFPMGLVLSADFVHSRGSGLTYIEENIKLISPTEAVTIDPRFSTIGAKRNVGWIRYTALQVHAQYRKRSLSSDLSYTLSKADSNLNNTGIFGGGPTNPFNLDVDKGPDATDQRHNLIFNGSYIFPYNFRLSGILMFRSARPWSPYTWENPEGLVYPPWPEGKNSRRGDSDKTMDVRMGKGFNFGDKLSATFFWEMYNALNWKNFYDYDGNLQSPSFGLPLAAGEMRRQQLGIRLDF